MSGENARRLIEELAAAKLAYAEHFIWARENYPGQNGKGCTVDEADALALLRLHERKTRDPEIVRFQIQFALRGDQ